MADALSILAIDDNDINLTTLEGMVRVSFPDAVFFCADNGPDAIALAQREVPDVILLDIIMPGMDGFEVCRVLKADPRTAKIPVIFVTAITADEDVRFRAVKLGAEGFLTKPVRLTELTAQIQQFTNKKAALRRSAENYQRLIEGLPDVVMRFDRDCRHTYVSPRVTEVVDLAPADFIGKTHRELGFPEGLCDTWESAIHRVYTDGRPLETEFSFVGKNGRMVFDWRLLPERNEQGAIESVLTISRDVTQSRRAEENYRDLFTQMQEGFAQHEIICDAQGRPVDYRFLAVNPAFERQTGLVAADIVGKTVLELMPQTEPHWIETYGEVALTGTPITFENYSAVLDRHFRVSAFRPAPGQFACLFSDITDRMKAESALRETRDYLDNLITYANAPIIVWDAEYRITRFNHAFEKITGRSVATVIGERLDVLFPPAFVTQSMRLIETTTSGKRWETVEIAIQHIDGSVRTVLWNSATLFAPDGKTAVATIAQGNDITERKQVERELRAAVTKLQALWSITSVADADVKKVSDHILATICGLTDSQYGFYGFINSDESVMTIHSWTGDAMRDCAMVDKPTDFPIAASGIWAEAVRRREPFILNDYGAHHPAKHGLPHGHVPLANLLVVPSFLRGRIASVAAVANRATPYHADDVAAITAFLTSIQAITEGKKAEEALRQSEERYRTVAFFTYDWEYWISPERKMLYCSPSCERITGYTAEEFVRNPQLLVDLVVPEDRPLVACHHESSPQTLEAAHELEFRITNRAGEMRWIAHVCRAVLNNNGECLCRRASNRDVTERKQAALEHERLSQQLTQAQKMESVGRLAGGVAHDFNNMIGVILGHVDLALLKAGATESQRANLEEIRKAAQRSANLTRQLLAFARKQTVTPKPVHLNEAVPAMLNMLRRLVGESIELVFIPGSGVGTVMIDPGQLDQILVNLTVNARDAVAGSGRITIETARVTLGPNPRPDETPTHPLDPERARQLVGPFVVLRVSDTGSGIDKETLEHIFEPFFTTKGAGRGTGLGLATVYGIVEQNQGFINVRTEKGRGSSLGVFLPQAAGSGVSVAEEDTQDCPPGHGETILLVEDEELVREMETIMLEQLGYRVLPASSPDAALALLDKHAGQVRVLMTDLVMPGMNGRQLADLVQKRLPGLPCVFVSGYADSLLVRQDLLINGLSFVAKPFSMPKIAGVLHKAVARSARNGETQGK